MAKRSAPGEIDVEVQTKMMYKSSSSPSTSHELLQRKTPEEIHEQAVLDQFREIRSLAPRKPSTNVPPIILQHQLYASISSITTRKEGMDTAPTYTAIDRALDTLVGRCQLRCFGYVVNERFIMAQEDYSERILGKRKEDVFGISHTWKNCGSS